MRGVCTYLYLPYLPSYANSTHAPAGAQHRGSTAQSSLVGQGVGRHGSSSRSFQSSPVAQPPSLRLCHKVSLDVWLYEIYRVSSEPIMPLGYCNCNMMGDILDFCQRQRADWTEGREYKDAMGAMIKTSVSAASKHTRQFGFYSRLFSAS